MFHIFFTTRLCNMLDYISRGILNRHCLSRRKLMKSKMVSIFLFLPIITMMLLLFRVHYNNKMFHQYLEFKNEREVNWKLHLANNRENSQNLRQNKDTERSYLVNMEEYLRFYLNGETMEWKKTFHSRYKEKANLAACPNLQRPSTQQLHKWKNVYQHFMFEATNKTGHVKKHDSYLLNFYFDDRFVETGNRFVRTVVAVRSSLSLRNKAQVQDAMYFNKDILFSKQYSLFWYEGFHNPVSSPCYVQGAAYLLMNVNGSFYYQYIVTCKYPEIHMKPVNISLVSQPCAQPTTYKAIIYPEPKRHPASRDIGICVQPMFGSLDKNDVTYLVSWLEMMKIFGVTEVSIANVSVTLKDPILYRMFKYYEDSGFLTLNQYPIINPTWTTEQDEKAGSYSSKQVAVSDCFLRKIKKYWYVIVHDMDELIVPYKHDTYVEYLESFTKSHPTHTYTVSLSVRSAYFYTYFPKDKKYVDYLPLLQNNKRFPPEPLGIPSQGGVGMSKSFYNMRSVLTPGSHMSYSSHNPSLRDTQSYLPQEDILVHHYRKHCDFINGGHLGCTNTSAMLTDNRLEKYADILIPKVEEILHQIGYFTQHQNG